MKAFSRDLRERILAAYDAGGVTRKAVAERFGVSEATVKKLLYQRKHLGHVDVLPRPGRPRKLNETQEKRLVELVEEQPDRTLAELRAELGVECTPQTINNALRRLGLSFKKKR